MEIVSQRFSGWGGISFKFKRMRKAGICWGGGQKKSQTKMDLEIHKNNSENYRHAPAAFRLLGIPVRITLSTAPVLPSPPIAFNARSHWAIQIAWRFAGRSLSTTMNGFSEFTGSHPQQELDMFALAGCIDTRRCGKAAG